MSKDQISDGVHFFMTDLIDILYYEATGKFLTKEERMKIDEMRGDEEIDNLTYLPPPPPPPISIDRKYNDDDIKCMFEGCKLKIEAIGSPSWHEEQQKRLREHFKLTD